MCGIAGYLEYKNDREKEILSSMCNTLLHRGPDDEGIKLIKNEGWTLGLGHRRLSIIDLTDQGRQPMQHKELSIVFNGEIYNYAEIKKELEDKHGCRFLTHSDTEVILQAFYQWGIKCIDRFIGMFAIGLFDQRDRKFYLIRDRAGVKPLFYYKEEGLFLFSSELKAFHEHPGFKKELDQNALGFFLQYGYIGAPHSIFRNTRKVLPGHYMVFDLNSGNIREEKYWDVFDYYNQPELDLSYVEAKIKLEEVLKSAFEYRMVSDVPVGVFLSGGYDSSLVTAMLQKNRTEKIKTFTIGFKESGFNEAKYAKKVAKFLGTDHREYYCTEQDALDLIPELPYYYDEPFGDASAIPTMLVSRMAREHVKVALSADGGDESFAGYTRYQGMLKSLSHINRIPGLLQKPAGQIIETLNKKPFLQQENYVLALYSTLIKDQSPGYNKRYWKKISDAALANLLPGKDGDEIITALDSGNLLNHHNDALSKMMAIDYKTYLPDYLLAKVDRATMSVSLEGRDPMMDHRIIEFAARLPLEYKFKEGVKKRILKEIVWKYIPKELMERPKMGFFLPISAWLKHSLKDQADYYLDFERIAAQGLFDPEELEKLKAAFYKRNKDHLALFIWFMLMFQMWYDRWMD